MNVYQNIKNYFFKLVPDLKNEAWDDLESRLTIQHYKKGDSICKAEEVCKKVSFLETGTARIYSIQDSKEVINYFFTEHEYLSEYESFISQKPAKCFIDALEDCITIDLSYKDVQILYLKHHQLERFGRYMAEFLFIGLSERNSKLMLLSPEERYQDLLKGHPNIQQIVPLYMIASYLNITPEALSRIRKRIVQPTK